jgi:hypothetical protein
MILCEKDTPRVKTAYRQSLNEVGSFPNEPVGANRLERNHSRKRLLPQLSGEYPNEAYRVARRYRIGCVPMFLSVFVLRPH